MWPAVVPALILSLFWLTAVIFAFLLVRKPFIAKILARFNHPLLLLILAALIVRLVPLLLLPVGAAYDVESFRLVGEALLKGEEVYTSAAAGRHPYLPLQMTLVAGSTYFAQTTSLPFVIWLKLPAVLADVPRHDPVNHGGINRLKLLDGDFQGCTILILPWLVGV